MQLSLVAAFIPIVNILWCDASILDCHPYNIMTKCEFEPCCVYNSLKPCCNSPTTPNESSLTDETVSQMKNNTNTFTVLETLLQEAKSERENITNDLTEVKTLLQVVKSELINVFNYQSEIKTLLQEIKSERENSVTEIKALRQEIKSEGENSSSVAKALLQEMKSEIKVILQEVKRELENVTDNSQSRDGVIPDGTTATPEGKELPKNCAELKVQGETSSGVQTVYPYGSLNPKQTTVYCDQVTDGGGWTVIQSRSPLPVRENFTRLWTEYVEGFGDLKGEFWLGLDNIHALTNSTQMALRIDLETAKGEKGWALYSTFHVGDAASKYVLRIGGYTGDAGDGMTYPSDKNWNVNGMKFSTFDNDNDLHLSGNCAEDFKGGWWFNYCTAAKLNGLPYVERTPKSKGILLNLFRGWTHSMRKATMKIRPVSLGF